MEKILKAKNWHVFLFFLVCSFILQILFLFSVLLLEKTSFFGIANGIIASTCIFIYGGWFYFVTIEISKKKSIYYPKEKLLVSWLYPSAFMFVLLYFFPQGFDFTTKMGTISPIVVSLFSLAYILALLSFFYLVYQTAKTIKFLEVQRPVSYKNFIVEMFLLVFLPIGIWFLQPKINKLAE